MKKLRRWTVGHCRNCGVPLNGRVNLYCSVRCGRLPRDWGVWCVNNDGDGGWFHDHTGAVYVGELVNARAMAVELSRRRLGMFAARRMGK